MSDYYDKNKYIRQLGQCFSDLTSDLTLKDWKNLRDKTYWESDGMAEIPRLKHKIECIKRWKIKNK